MHELMDPRHTTADSRPISSRTRMTLISTPMSAPRTPTRRCGSSVSTGVCGCHFCREMQSSTSAPATASNAAPSARSPSILPTRPKLVITARVSTRPQGAVCRGGSRYEPVGATAMPCAPNARAMARPIPLLPPVTSATFPCSSSIRQSPQNRYSASYGPGQPAGRNRRADTRAATDWPSLSLTKAGYHLRQIRGRHDPWRRGTNTGDRVHRPVSRKTGQRDLSFFEWNGQAD